MPVWFTSPLYFLTALLQSPSWATTLAAAVLSAVLAATATHWWQLRREREQRVRELRGITRLLYEEMETNRSRLAAVSTGAPARPRVLYFLVPDTGVWDKSNLRLAQLLEDDKLLASLVEYYTVAHHLAEFIRASSGDPNQDAMNHISLQSRRLIKLSDDIRPRPQILRHA